MFFEYLSLGPGDYNTQSCDVTIQLAEGDEIFVTSDKGYQVTCCSSTSFTGFLIKADF